MGPQRTSRTSHQPIKDPPEPGKRATRSSKKTGTISAESTRTRSQKALNNSPARSRSPANEPKGSPSSSAAPRSATPFSHSESSDYAPTDIEDEPVHADASDPMDLDELENPTKTGTGPKPWICTFETCTKAFQRKSDLVRRASITLAPLTHADKRIHANCRPFVCPYDNCGKAFIQRSALTVHIRTHTGERPHRCDQCTKGFADSSSLARHVRPIASSLTPQRRTHSNTRPYICTIDGCTKTFCRKITLTKHQGRDHPDHSPEDASLSSPEEPSTPSPLRPVRNVSHRKLKDDDDWTPDSLEAANWQQMQAQQQYEHEQQSRLLGPPARFGLQAYVSDLRSASEAPPTDDEHPQRRASLPLPIQARTPTLVPASPPHEFAAPPWFRQLYGHRHSLPTPTQIPSRADSPVSSHSAPAQIAYHASDSVQCVLSVAPPAAGEQRVPSWSTAQSAVHRPYPIPSSGNLHLNQHAGSSFVYLAPVSPRNSLTALPTTGLMRYEPVQSFESDTYTSYRV